MLVIWSKKTDYNTKITDIENKILDTIDLVVRTDFNSKVT